MVTEKRLETLQDEIKLLKGEVKNSLASVRDYLLNSELPSAELSNLGLDQGEQRIRMKTDAAAGARVPELASDFGSDTATEQETPPEDEDLISVAPPLDEETTESGDDMTEEVTEDTPQDLLESEEDEEEEAATDSSDELPEDTLPDEEAPMDYGRTVLDESPNTPRVNMLANLITWVARAKRDIGYEQLSTFLEVYGLSGHLSPEMKEVILRFAEITIERPDSPGSADIWSQSMLSLHGILTGGDAPQHPAIPAWTHPAAAEPAVKKERPVEAKKPPAPVKLKLVFPDDDGGDKEFCLDLTPEAVGRKDRRSSREG